MAHSIYPELSQLSLDLECAKKAFDALGAPESWRVSYPVPEMAAGFSLELLRSVLLHWDWELGEPEEVRDIHSVAALSWTGYAEWTKWDQPEACLRRPKQALLALARYVWPGSIIQWEHDISNPGGSYWGYTTWLFDGQELVEVAYLKDWNDHPMSGN